MGPEEYEEIYGYDSANDYNDDDYWDIEKLSSVVWRRRLINLFKYFYK